jgi:isoquinoline 1-oxidoreductase beta subunit
MPQVEMGQGVYTAVAMILAEELDAAFERVVLEAAPPNDKLYGNPTLGGLQVTGNSNSIRAFWMPLRKAAAGTRAMLVQAASQIWKVDPASIRTENSTVIHDASGWRLDYAALIDRASGLTAPQNPVLKDPKDFKLVGKPVDLVDDWRSTSREKPSSLPSRSTARSKWCGRVKRTSNTTSTDRCI